MNDEIDLKQLIKIVIDSKKIITFFTLIFVVAGLSFNHYVNLNKTRTFESSAKVIFGQYNNSPLRDYSNITSEIKFIFGNNVQLKDFGSFGIEIITRGPSVKESDDFLDNIIQYLREESEKKSNYLKKVDEDKIESLNSQISLMSKSIEHFDGFYVKKIISESEYRDNIFSINLNINNTISEINGIKSKIIITPLKVYTKSSAYLISSSRSYLKVLILSFVIGLIFSTLLAVLKFRFNKIVTD